MARKLKTFVTSLGFFDQAVAAPSMKAALKAWGMARNLFKNGFAKETDDPAIVEATLEHPGVVLKRPVGSEKPFKEHADLPTFLVDSKSTKTTPAKSSTRSRLSPSKSKISAKKAAEAYEREEKRREKERQKEKLAHEKAEKQRRALQEKAKADLQAAETSREMRIAKLEKKLEFVKEEIEKEEADWTTQKAALTSAIKKLD